jgi:hypothetical protein
MNRKEHFKAVQELRDKVRDGMTRYYGSSDEPVVAALLGKLERFENYLCTTPLSTLRADIVKLTLLRLQARRLNLYQFKRNPTERWIERYKNWCDDTR